MLSISGKNWEEIKVNKRSLEKLILDSNFSRTLSKLIVYRNFNRLEVETINNDIELFNPFLRNIDFLNGTEILKNSIKKKEKILIVGDYDVDGCVSTSLFVNLLRKLKCSYSFYIPHRFKDGYGASLNLIKKLEKKKPGLVIMVDCGSSSKDSIKYLKSKNIKNIIIDHHDIFHPYPSSNCLINPKKNCDYNEYDYLCSSTLCYFFIDLFIRKNKIKINFENNLFYVLLATITDVMPLRKINRILAIFVLKNNLIVNNFLLKKIFSIKKIKRPFEIDDLGFLIGPILNSAGRLGDANIIVELLTSDNNVQKEKIIDKLYKLNEKRKEIEKISFNEINLEKIERNNDHIIVEYKNIFSEGIIGILASKLKEYFNKPSIVLTKSVNVYKGSARSIPDFNIGKYIKECIDKDILKDGGGHHLAGGVILNKDKILEFKNYINQAFISNNSNISKKFVSKISINSINKKFYNDLIKIGPFGPNNLNPFFLLEKVKIIQPKIIKNDYLSFYVKSGSGKMIPSISFNYMNSNINKTLLIYKKEIDLIVQIKENLWNNKKNLQLIVSDIIQFPNKA